MARRCGNRIQGGVYIELPLSKYGEPIESFICDPAIIVTADLAVPERGVVLRTGPGGQQMLLDYIGENNYPNVLDFIEEVRTQGLSRRIPENFDFSQLTEDVVYCAIHKKGYVHNESWYRQYARDTPLVRDDDTKLDTPWPCPHAKHKRDEDRDFPCSAVWWHDIRPGYGVKTDITRRVAVEQAEGPPYIGLERPAGIVPVYDDAIIMILPVRKIAVIRGEDGEHEEAMKKASKTGKGVEVTLEDA